MNLDEFTSFLLSPQHRRIVLFAGALVLVLCFTRRRSPWIITLWLPSFVLAGGYTGLLASQFVRGITGQGPDSGWYIFAGMMQTMVGFPIVIGTVLLLVAHPARDAWHPRYLVPAIAATVLAPIILIYCFNTSKPLLSFAVTDEDGRPLAGVALRDISDSPPRAVTDQTGIVRQRLPYRMMMGGVFTAEGYQEHHVEIMLTGNRGETYCVDHSWYERVPKIINTTNERVFYSSRPPVSIPIIMKKSLTK